MQVDPIGFGGGDFNLYRYVLNNPIKWVDPLGLEVRVYGAKTFGGVAGAKHTFVWSTEANAGAGRSGAYGRDMLGTGGIPNGFDPATSKLPYNVVTDDLNGMTEAEFIEFIRQLINISKWYFPGADDCHNALEDAFIAAGVDYPGAPDGRSDWDEGASALWNSLKQGLGSGRP